MPSSNAARASLSSALSSLAGSRATTSLAALSAEDLLDGMIARIEGTNETSRRPGALARVAQIEADLLATVRALREDGGV